MTYSPYRECPFRPRTSWWKRLASTLTLGAYLPSEPPACQCRDCWTHVRAMQAIWAALDEGNSEP